MMWLAAENIGGQERTTSNQDAVATAHSLNRINTKRRMHDYYFNVHFEFDFVS
jgi:hypothetical protein